MNPSLLYLGFSFAICLVCSALGFWNVVYFVSLSYALSIAAQSLFFAAIFSDTISGWPLVQSMTMLVYGLRLGSFLLLRARSAGFQSELKEAQARGSLLGAPARIAVWLGVSLLYVTMFLPSVCILTAEAKGVILWSLPVGVTIMITGLALEATADWQKSRFKLNHPKRFCDEGLYRLVRCPNYLGEMLFWFGVWLSGVAAYQATSSWILCTVGLLCIEGVMIGSTRRLELKQAKEYGADPAYRLYAQTVRVLIPWIPLYSLRKSRGALR
jgi:steroid 5-alpha reductase family enzyme